VLGLGAALLAIFPCGSESRSPAPVVKAVIFRIRSDRHGQTRSCCCWPRRVRGCLLRLPVRPERSRLQPAEGRPGFPARVDGIIVGAGISQGILGRVGVRNVSVVGLALATAGLLVLTRLPVHGHYVSDLLSGLLPLSIGMGLVFVPDHAAGYIRCQQRRLRPGLRIVQPARSRSAAHWAWRSSRRCRSITRRACSTMGRPAR